MTARMTRAPRTSSASRCENAQGGRLVLRWSRGGAAWTTARACVRLVRGCKLVAVPCLEGAAFGVVRYLNGPRAMFQGRETRGLGVRKL